MRKRGHMNPAPLFALRAWRCWHGGLGATAAPDARRVERAPIPYSPRCGVSPGGSSQAGGITLKLMVCSSLPSVGELDARYDDNIYLTEQRSADQICADAGAAPGGSRPTTLSSCA